MRPLVPLLAAIFLGAAPLSAQQVRGVVRDAATGQPLDRAVVVLLAGDSMMHAATLSDGNGAFVLRAPVGDSVVLRAQQLGYRTHRSDPMVVQRDAMVEVSVSLRQEAVAIEGLTVTAPLNKDLHRFLRNRELGYGKFLTPEDIARLRPANTVQLLVGTPGSFLVPGGSGRGVTSVRRPSGTSAEGICTPWLYIDGHVLEPDFDSRTRQMIVRVDSYVRPDEIRAVEVYRNPSNAPSEYQRPFMRDCPVVLIWTDFGFGFRKRRG
jgi:hypothetical protein